MFWQRTSCIHERNDRARSGGELWCMDALQAPLEPYYGKLQCVYLDPPSLSGNAFSHKMPVGTAAWQGGRGQILLPAYQDFSPNQEQDYLSRLRQLLVLAHKLLNESGSFFLHLDDKAPLRARLLAEEVFGRDQLVNEIIWRFKAAGRSLRSFSSHHHTLLFYAKNSDHFFDLTQIPSARKSTRGNHLKRGVDEKGRAYRSLVSGGKTYIYYDDEPIYPDDVWDDLAPSKEGEKTGYPNQRPQSLMERMILSTTRPNDLVADLCFGSASFLAAAALSNRRFIGLDSSPVAFMAARKRLDGYEIRCNAPLSGHEALLEAGITSRIGYYDLALKAYTLPSNSFDGASFSPKSLKPSGLDSVDQCYAGLLHNGVFTSYSSSLRSRQCPALKSELEIPLLTGAVAVMLVDIMGRRSLWTGSGNI